MTIGRLASRRATVLACNRDSILIGSGYILWRGWKRILIGRLSSIMMWSLPTTSKLIAKLLLVMPSG